MDRLVGDLILSELFDGITFSSVVLAVLGLFYCFRVAPSDIIHNRSHDHVGDQKVLETQLITICKPIQPSALDRP
jgi:hypothetical protein